MRSSILAAALAASSVLASSGHKGFEKSPRSHIPPASHREAKRGSYSLVSSLSGQKLLSAFTFNEESQDNGGVAAYVSESTAYANDMLGVGSDNAVHLRVDDTKTVSGQRNAIKITSQATYGVGDLIIVDTARQPQVCGAWPAIWFTSVADGITWPEGGELDLNEYVSLETKASFSAHTSQGCYMGTSGYKGVQMLTGSSGLDCNPADNSDQGCGFRSSQANSTGQGINANGGGVHAIEIASTGISMWVFTRDNVPSDITSKSPSPSSWTTPDFFLSSDNCSPISSYYHDLALIINTNLCGEWAGTVWSDDLSYAGQTLAGSCASQTGYSTCAAYVAAEGQDFKHAYWKINSISTYN